MKNFLAKRCSADRFFCRTRQTSAQPQHTLWVCSGTCCKVAQRAKWLGTCLSSREKSRLHVWCGCRNNAASIGTDLHRREKAASDSALPSNKHTAAWPKGRYCCRAPGAWVCTHRLPRLDHFIGAGRMAELVDGVRDHEQRVDGQEKHREQLPTALPLLLHRRRWCWRATPSPLHQAETCLLRLKCSEVLAGPQQKCYCDLSSGGQGREGCLLGGNFSAGAGLSEQGPFGRCIKDRKSRIWLHCFLDVFIYELFR